MGYYPSKICALLNIILMVGWGTIDCIVGGQVLSAVSGGSMTIVVGAVIVALVGCVIAVFGMKIFHLYERLVVPACSTAGSTSITVLMQVRLVSSNSGALYPRRFLWATLQHHASVHGHRNHTSSQSLLIPHHLLLHTQLMGCS